MESVLFWGEPLEVLAPLRYHPPPWNTRIHPPTCLHSGRGAGDQPLILRRLLLRSTCSLATLHASFQIISSWERWCNYTLSISTAGTGLRRVGGPPLLGRPRQGRLASFACNRGERFTYVYNFIGHWVCGPPARSRPCGWTPRRGYHCL